MGIRELRKEASRLGIKYSGLKKAELEPLVSAALAKENSAAESSEPSREPATCLQPPKIAGHIVVGNEIDGRPAAEVLASMSKGDARKLRKALRAGGRPDLAATDIRTVRKSKAAA